MEENRAIVNLLSAMPEQRFDPENGRHLLEEGFVAINLLKGLWEPMFSYKRLVNALDKAGIPQRKYPRRREVNAEQFVLWIDIVKKTAASSGINPSDRSTWTDETWDCLEQEVIRRYNIQNEIREGKKRREVGQRRPASLGVTDGRQTPC